MSGEDPALKVVIVGDGAIGKTCQLRKIMHSKGALTNKEGVKVDFDIHEKYEATTFDTQILEGLVYKGKQYNLELWDTAGQESMESLRKLSYPDADLFLLGFSIESPISMDNILEKWVPDIESTVPSADIILAGFKCDMRAEKGDSCVQKKDGQSTAYDINCSTEQVKCRAYIETSAMTGENCELLLELLLAVAAERKMSQVTNFGALDKAFPAYAPDLDGSFPSAKSILHPPEHHQHHNPPATDPANSEEPGCQCTVQ